MLPQAQYQTAADFVGANASPAQYLTRAVWHYFAPVASMNKTFCCTCTKDTPATFSSNNSHRNDSNAVLCLETQTALNTCLEFTYLDPNRHILCLVTFGQCNILIDDASVELTEQQACVIKQPETKIVINLSLQAHAQLLFIDIPTPTIGDFLNNNPSIDCFIPCDIHEEMRREMLAILRDDSHPQLRNTLNLHRATTLTLLHFRQLLTQQDSRSKKHALKNEDVLRFKSIQQRIHENYLNPPTLSELAREVGINKNKLCRGFKTLFGMSIATYVQHYRLELARSLLNKSNYNIAFIADAVGYEHAGNFTAAFKKKYGELPKAARHSEN